MNNLQKGVAVLVGLGVAGVGSIATAAADEPGLGIIAVTVISVAGIVAWAVDRAGGPRGNEGDE